MRRTRLLVWMGASVSLAGSGTAWSRQQSAEPAIRVQSGQETSKGAGDGDRRQRNSTTNGDERNRERDSNARNRAGSNRDTGGPGTAVQHNRSPNQTTTRGTNTSPFGSSGETKTPTVPGSGIQNSSNVVKETPPSWIVPGAQGTREQGTNRTTGNDPGSRTPGNPAGDLNRSGTQLNRSDINRADDVSKGRNQIPSTPTPTGVQEQKGGVGAAATGEHLGTVRSTGAAGSEIRNTGVGTAGTPNSAGEIRSGGASPTTEQNMRMGAGQQGSTPSNGGDSITGNLKGGTIP